MDPAGCPHRDDHIAQRVCRHLWQHEADAYAHRFTGEGLTYDLVCPSCAEVSVTAEGAGDGGAAGLEAELAHVCTACFEGVAGAAQWAAGEWAVIGRPEVAERATRLTFQHEMVRLPVALTAPLLEMQPLPAAPGAPAEPVWLALTQTGALVRIDLGRREWAVVAELAGVGVDPDRPLSLTVAPRGDMAAVVETRGGSGVVVDVQSGELTMMLDRGPHRLEGARFPVAFSQLGERLLLVHGTGWNRLDLSDPRTGEPLAPPRDPGDGHDDGDRSRALDYACSSLTVSPDGEWVVDNGFSTQQAGLVAGFRVRPWLEGNPWEPEDGPSKRYLCQRWDYWDGPLCWLDRGTLAVWGYGPDGRCLAPAVIVFDLESGDAVRWFPGPRGQLVLDGRFLCSLDDAEGVSVWDPDSGERLLHDAGFQPLRYHPGAKQFLTTNPGGELFVVSRLVGEP